MTAEIAAAQQTAIERIAHIVQKHQIDCDFVRLPGYMFQGLPSTSKDYETDTLKSVLEAAQGTGKLDVTLIDNANIVGFPSGPAIKYGSQATFHPTKYVRALAEVVTGMGGQIFEQTHMNDYNEVDGGVTAVMVNGKKVHAKEMVMATNAPLQKVSKKCHSLGDH